MSRQTEYIPIEKLQEIVPSYTREREMEMWDRNGPSGDNLAALPPQAADLTLRYAEHPDGILDIYLPAGDPTISTLVFAVHGGAWRSDWDRTYLTHLARSIADSGAVVALPEFRRVGSGGEFPANVQDVLAALRFSRAAIAEAAPGWVDPSGHVVVVGHSSGAHLGPLAALQAGPEIVSKIVAIAPPFDLEFLSQTRAFNGAVDDMLGGTREQAPDNYAAANVFPLVNGDIPVVAIQGVEDLQLTCEMARRAERQLRGTAQFSYAEIADADHFDPINPSTTACRDIVIPAILG